MGSPSTSKLVVHVVQQMAPGGIETLVLDLFRADPSDTHVISLVGERSALVSSWPALEQMGETLTALQLKPGLSPTVVARLAVRLRSMRPACVFLHHIGPLLYGGFAARLSGVPRLYHVEHDAWHYRSPKHQRLLQLVEWVVGPRHIAVAWTVRERMRELIPSAAIAVVAPGIDLGRFVPRPRHEARRRLGLREDWRIVGTAGRLAPIKGQLHLVEALRCLPKDVHLVIAGEGPERSALLARAQALGFAPRVHLIGHRDDLEFVLPAFDVFCLPSLSEGLPRSVLEAQALDLPVVASRVGALEEAVCPDTGVLVDAGNISGLAHALVSSLRRQAPEGASRAFVEKYFSLHQTIAAFREVAAGSRQIAFP